MSLYDSGDERVKVVKALTDLPKHPIWGDALRLYEGRKKQERS